MSWLDKLLGREKKAEATGEMQSEGMGEDQAPPPSTGMPETPEQPAQGEQQPPSGTP
jgi:hypothetical protein